MSKTPRTQTQQIVVDTQRYKVFVNKKPIETLTPKEFDLLKLLAEKDGIVVDRGTILNEVWGTKEAVDTRTVDQHVARLRRKLGNHRHLTGNYRQGLAGVVLTVATRGYAVEGVKVV